MMKIAISSDTNCGLTVEEGINIGAFLLPMPIMIDGEEFFEGESCTYEMFFESLLKGSDVKSSQPSPLDVTELWDSLLKEYDQVIHIPMSSALSGSYETAKMLSKDYEGKVFVVDNKRISVSLLSSIEDAVRLVKEGKTVEEIAATLEATALESRIYITLETLELLKKSGRITAASAAIATVLNIKPVLEVNGEKLNAIAKVHGSKKAKKLMIETAQKDMETFLKNENISVYIAYTGTDVSEGEKWRDEVQEVFPEYSVEMYRLPLSICCHVGAGVLGVGLVKRA